MFKSVNLTELEVSLLKTFNIVSSDNLNIRISMR